MRYNIVLKIFLNCCIAEGADQPRVPELRVPAERPDPGPAPPPAGQGGVVAGVSPQTPSQPRHEAAHPQPLLVPVLPPGRLVSHSPHPRRHHSGCGQTSTMLLLQGEK